MKSTIKDIYYGKKGHFETIKASEEYWEVLKQVVKLDEEFSSQLTDKQREQFLELLFAHMGTEAELASSHFREGFKLGILLGLEVAE